MKNLIAILRGISPQECPRAAEALLKAGFSQMEIPLNSPRPLDSISVLAKEFGDALSIGAGTVLTAQAVVQSANAGAQFVVSPNCNPAVIRATKKAKMLSLPGAFTASECFAALQAGADILKLFPASQAGPQGLRALKSVLPPDAKVFAVGGISEKNFSEWMAAGVDGFGIGGELYRPGMTAGDIAKRAKKIALHFQKSIR